MTDPMSPDVAAVLAEVHSRHSWHVGAHGATCGCGQTFGWMSHGSVVEWRAHLADAQTAALVAAGLVASDGGAYMGGDRVVTTRDGFVTEFNAQSDKEAAAYKAGWADCLSEIRDEDGLREKASDGCS